eukprot:6177968-Pleurochrysis_carterae.AAC.2
MRTAPPTNRRATASRPVSPHMRTRARPRIRPHAHCCRCRDTRIRTQVRRAASLPDGDLMAALKDRMNLRRKGISGERVADASPLVCLLTPSSGPPVASLLPRAPLFFYLPLSERSQPLHRGFVEFGTAQKHART